jgi:ribulose-phosphate 3-epimerase
VSWERWSGRVEVEPSLYAADFSRLGEQVDALLDAGARVFHFDVGDGHFIDEITIGPVVLQSISEAVHERGGMLDCHLMVSRPSRHFEQIRAAGGDSVTFHVEAEGEPIEIVARARDLELGVGLAFNPETPVERAVAAAVGVDLVLLMSIHPGLSGQEFMPDALGRIAALRRLLPKDVSVQVDGGVHSGNAATVREAGANLFVSGSGIFWHDDPAAAYRELRDAAGAPERREEGARR